MGDKKVKGFLVGKIVMWLYHSLAKPETISLLVKD